jgi:hypothetical protein
MYSTELFLTFFSQVQPRSKLFSNLETLMRTVVAAR